VEHAKRAGVTEDFYKFKAISNSSDGIGV